MARFEVAWPGGGPGLGAHACQAVWPKNAPEAEEIRASMAKDLVPDTRKKGGI